MENTTVGGGEVEPSVPDTRVNNSTDGSITVKGGEAEPSVHNTVKEAGQEVVKGGEAEPSGPDTTEDPPSVKKS